MTLAKTPKTGPMRVAIDTPASWKEGISAKSIAKAEFAMECMRTGIWPERRSKTAANETEEAKPLRSSRHRVSATHRRA